MAQCKDLEFDREARRPADLACDSEAKQWLLQDLGTMHSAEQQK